MHDPCAALDIFASQPTSPEKARPTTTATVDSPEDTRLRSPFSTLQADGVLDAVALRAMEEAQEACEKALASAEMSARTAELRALPADAKPRSPEPSLGRRTGTPGTAAPASPAGKARGSPAAKRGSPVPRPSPGPRSPPAKASPPEPQLSFWSNATPTAAPPASSVRKARAASPGDACSPVRRYRASPGASAGSPPGPRSTEDEVARAMADAQGALELAENIELYTLDPLGPALEPTPEPASPTSPLKEMIDELDGAARQAMDDAREVRAVAGSLRGAIIGCGFFARFHLHAWHECPSAQIVALCDTDAAQLAKAQRVAERFGARPQCFRSAKALFGAGLGLDFVDIATQVDAHKELVVLAAASFVPHVVCQKPLAPSLADAREMVEACEASGARLAVHENWRFQAPLLSLAAAAGEIGQPTFCHLSARSPFDPRRQQPYLAEGERLIVQASPCMLQYTPASRASPEHAGSCAVPCYALPCVQDLGAHLLDAARVLMGSEFASVYCSAQRLDPTINGEDSATIVLRTADGATAVLDMCYGCSDAPDPFPQTTVRLEGPRGTLKVAPGYALSLARGSELVRRWSAPPARHMWASPERLLVHDAVASFTRHLASP
jgi:predicted dehydrogenase